MKKNILFGNNVVIEMTLEDVVERFKKQVTYFAMKCEKQIMGSDLTKEDYEQIGYMTLVEAFVDYDDTYVFSTYLDTKLRGEKTKIMSKVCAEKRKVNYLKTSLDEESKNCEDGATLLDVIGEVDHGIEDFDGDDFVKGIVDRLNKEERLMYLHIIENGMKPVDYARKIGVNRQNVNYKLKRLKERLLKLYNAHNAGFYEERKVETMDKGILMAANEIVNERVEEMAKEVTEQELQPKLTIVRVGNDPASEKYVNNKVKLGEKVGIEVDTMILPEETSQKTLIEKMKNKIYGETGVDGILLQLPLPKHINEGYVLQEVPCWLDVDGFTSGNLGKLMRGEDIIQPCTPKGIMTMLNHYNIDIKGKDVVIVNRSNIVGKPLAMMMLKEDATVTICHSKTKDLKDKIFNADIVVTAVGQANFLNYHDFSDDTTIIDVSINFDENGKMCGDVCKNDYEDLMKYKKCNITPVPNGIGPMTVLSLMENVVEMHKRNVIF